MNHCRPEEVGMKELWKDTGGFMAQKGLCNVAKEKRLEDRGALPTENGSRLSEHKAMHEKLFAVIGCARMSKKKKQK